MKSRYARATFRIGAIGTALFASSIALAASSGETSRAPTIRFHPETPLALAPIIAIFSVPGVCVGVSGVKPIEGGFRIETMFSEGPY